MKRRKKRMTKKSLVFLGVLATVILICFAGLLGVYASLTDSDQKQNDLQMADLSVDIVEEFDKPSSFLPDTDYIKKVQIKNTSNQDSFVRVLASPMITKSDGNGGTILLASTTGGANPILTIDYNTTDWIDGNDGYFYYIKKLAKDEVSPYLFTKVTMNSENISEKYDNVNLTFDIKAEAINCTKYAYRDAWWNGNIPTTNPLMTVDNELKNQVIN